jgi:hypothetical protein
MKMNDLKLAGSSTDRFVDLAPAAQRSICSRKQNDFIRLLPWINRESITSGMGAEESNVEAAGREGAAQIRYRSTGSAGFGQKAGNDV